ncbi:MAG: hypothetical protein WA431_04190 [Candidatus Cybelea sp.]
MNTDRRPCALTVAFIALIAAAFFFAGYAVRATRIEAAGNVPVATPPPPDGNPSGHRLELPKSYAPRVPSTALTSCLEVLAKNPIAVRYVTAPHVAANPTPSPALPIPQCKDRTCVPFSWPNMTLSTQWLDHTASPEALDIYGTFDSQ